MESLAPINETYDPVNPEDSLIAVISINPQKNVSVTRLKQEIICLRKYAEDRIILADQDLTPATDDLALIANLKKAVTEKMDEYVKPIKGHLESVQAVFKDILAILNEANALNREKVTAYRDEQKRRQAEAEEINRQKAELARKEAAFNGTGETTVDMTPVEAAPVVNKVSTNTGTVSTQKVWKWELIDMALVPEEYKIIDAAKITKVVKAGLRNIPGIRVYQDETLRVSAR